MGWKSDILKNLCLIGDGNHSSKYPKKSEMVECGVPFIRGTNIVDGELSDTDVLYITEKKHAALKKGHLKVGDVLITNRGEIGKIAIVDERFDGANLNSQIAWLRCGGRLTPQYLYYFMQSNAMRNHFNKEKSGAALQQFPIKMLNVVEVNYPPILEQKRIVAILDQAFADIEQARAKTEQNLKNARELFESYLQQVFSQRGDGWVETRLENLCSFSSGGTPSKKNTNYWGGDIPWMSGKDMKATQLFDSFLHITQVAVNEKATRIAMPGTILTLVRGMGLAHGAQVAELMVPSAFNQDIKGIHPKSNIVSRYLVFALRHGINTSDNALSNAAHGTLKINMDALKNIIIPVPSEEHQNQIVDNIDALIKGTESLNSIYEKKLESLDELKKSILQKAFSGELTKPLDGDTNRGATA
jgi:type I restriction enzyme S subunit